MPGKFLYQIIILSGIMAVTTSCSSVKNFSTKFYYQNGQALDQIEESYKNYYAQGPFNIVFTDKQFSIISIEIKTDSLTYVYQFEVNEPRLTDTLNKYHLNAAGITALIRQMQSIQCIWINTLDYYTDDQKRLMVFISIKPKTSNSPFAYKKYYILSYFTQPQYFDSEGRLLVKRRLNKIHEINGDIFHRINDRICYTVSGRFR
jgi:hypothetical protein